MSRRPDVFLSQRHAMRFPAVDRSILITGASSGIGLAAATIMAGRGWQVFATVRPRRGSAEARRHCRRHAASDGLCRPRLDRRGRRRGARGDRWQAGRALQQWRLRPAGRSRRYFDRGAAACPRGQRPWLARPHAPPRAGHASGRIGAHRHVLFNSRLPVDALPRRLQRLQACHRGACRTVGGWS